MNQEILKSIMGQLSPSNLLLAAVILLIAWLTTYLLRFANKNFTQRFSRYRIGIQRFFLIAQVMVWASAIIFTVFGVLRPSTKVLFGMAASIGLAFGLASQELLKNFISWLIVMVTRSVSLGDMLRVNDDYGEIIAITPNLTRLRTFDDSQVTFPTAWLLSKNTSNANAGSLREMVVVKLRVPAYLDPVELRQIAWDAAANSPYTCLNKRIITLIGDEFDHTFLTELTLKCYVLDVRLERLQVSHLTQLIKRELIKRNLLNKSLITGLLNDCPTSSDTI